MLFYINTFADLNDLRSAEKERDDMERGIVYILNCFQLRIEGHFVFFTLLTKFGNILN